MLPFNRSTVIITGASRGVGRNIARVFARDTDHSLFLLARDSEALEQVKSECLSLGAAAVEHDSVDLTDEESVDGIVWPSALPKPAVLVNNAGSFLFKKLQHTSPDEFESQWVINAKMPFMVTKKFLPVILTQQRGLIATITSVGALSGQAGSGAYSSSKHAALGFSRSLRKELRGTNVAVTSINMGQTMSTSWEGVDVDAGELNDPEDIGKLIAGLTRLSPQSVVEEMTVRPIGGGRSAM